jgi:hypothetical protein
MSRIIFTLNRRAILTSFKNALQSVGYESRLIADDYAFADFEGRQSVVHRVPLAAFSGYPCTYRNACIGLVFSDQQQMGSQWVHRHRALGAPLIFEVCKNEVQAWGVGPDKAKRAGDAFGLDAVERIFHSKRTLWNPDTLGRLKTPSDAKPNRQLDFYDTGLMPVLAEFFRTKLKDLLERAFADTAECYKSVHHQQPAVAYLFPYLFRFVTAKIFMDRADAHGWDKLDDPLKILQKAEQHSGSGLLEKLPETFLDKRILAKAWSGISGTLHFQNLSVPDLADTYESSFINDKTRKELGVHSTPRGLADYIVEHLPWDDLPVDKRLVFEPFNGHGIFLACAMERLGRDLDPNLTPPQRHKYFQKMLVGVEKDPLAIEVCRLILTLSDYPNNNSWQLHPADVFTWPGWDDTLKSAAVVLANPPYEVFPTAERRRIGAVKDRPPAEFLHRLMRQPPPMLGLVLPQSFLTGPIYQDANRQIAQHYEQVSIVELPRIFRYADNETIAILASKRRKQGRQVIIHYAEVPPSKSDEFLEDFKVVSERSAKLDFLKAASSFTLWIPPKGSVFDCLTEAPTLGKIAKIRQGLHWIPRTDGKPRTAPRTDVASDIPQKGFQHGAEKMAGNLTQFQLRKLRYLSTLPEHHHSRDKAWRNPWAERKAVCNACRFERKSPWRLAAWADAEGLAFTKAYFAIWPQSGVSEFAIAAILCSPLASAFSFERDLDRSNRIATLEKLPMPAVDHLGSTGQIHRLAKNLQQLLSNEDFTHDAAQDNLIEALVRLDAAVLDAYELPARVQRQLLNQFQGWKRPIAALFTGYFPPQFKDVITLKDFVAIQYDYDTTNERRCDLIEKELSKSDLTSEEREELDHLQHLADLLVRLKDPYPLEELTGLISELKSKGKWKASA